MKILTVGKHTRAGSWIIRGQQLGGQLGRTKMGATLDDMRKADVVIAVKRFTPTFLKDIKQLRKPWIWDLVDFYPQPKCSTWSREKAIEWVLAEIKKANPTGIVYPNQQMKDDIGLPGKVIYHHARPNAPLNPIREQVKTVGYEGGEQYINGSLGLIRSACALRGWSFRTDLPLHELDIVLAFRDKPHNGYVQTNWKSNVKLANAHASGTPFVGGWEAGYAETSSGREILISDPSLLKHAFEYLTPYGTRREIHEAFIKQTITLHSAAEQMREYVETILRDK